ncbi:exo-alpha-sialidase [Jannaschia formosa]|uniref:exo-alpha-sialidase n=1 Tax=Jannaschia formosa TaxID=2259592 RepID=UPI001074A4F0|nr:exo-alpha-sialidase [Jannaschia formosa]TFL18894.1 exo-alpha-sialidase [Jannaschia formosa]
MSWTEPQGAGFAVRMAMFDGAGWGPARTIIASGDLFVNWVDIPSVAAFEDGTLAAHWLQQSDRATYAYDVHLSLSKDGGQGWGHPIVPHEDRQGVQHGFVSLLPYGDDMLSIWLDAREYASGGADAPEGGFSDSMQLRATRLASDGSLSEDVSLDARTCSCCQTSAALTGDGAALVAYRDRTETEIRDISVVRYDDEGWSEPVNVHEDGWQIAGCPVNGPAIDAHGARAVVAWFTAPDGEPAVMASFSQDAGRSFLPPHRLDLGDAIGRVDTIILQDGTALVSWVEWTEEGEALMVCRVTAEEGCLSAGRLHLNTGAGSLNFPRMVGVPGGVLFAWTQPGANISGDEDQIQLVLGRL